jgi:hypothetical protein
MRLQELVIRNTKQKHELGMGLGHYKSEEFFRSQVFSLESWMVISLWVEKRVVREGRILRA